MTDIRILTPGWLVARIGETAILLGLYARMRDMGWLEPFDAVVLAPPESTANPTLLHYFLPWLRVVESQDQAPDAGPFDLGQVTLPNGKRYPYDRAALAAQKTWEDLGRGPLLSLTEKHRAAGEQALERLGVPPGWFVALHVRERGYMADTDPRGDVHNDYRNADVKTYMDAVREITAAGGSVIRIGDPTMMPLSEMPGPETEGLFDYAHSDIKCEWMDIYLLGAARFFLGTTSGPWVVAGLFGTPVAMANNSPMSERPFSARDVYISKLYINDDGAPLSFSDSFQPPYRHCFDYQGAVRDNTADEIRELTIEMMERLDGRARYGDEDQAFQARIIALSEAFEDYGVQSRMGRDFLRRHRELLA